MPKIIVAPEVQYCTQTQGLPSNAVFAEWAICVKEVANVDDLNSARTFVVRLVDCEEMQHLNAEWRGKDSATNVLAFPFEQTTTESHIPLGDIVICLPVVCAEAKQQAKPLIDRLAHMFVHGLLHLLGYDHQTAAEANIMEAFEQEALARLGYASPYEVDSDQRPGSQKG